MVIKNTKAVKKSKNTLNAFWCEHVYFQKLDMYSF